MTENDKQELNQIIQQIGPALQQAIQDGVYSALKKYNADHIGIEGLLTNHTPLPPQKTVHVTNPTSTPHPCHPCGCRIGIEGCFSHLHPKEELRPDGMDMRTKSNHHFGKDLIGELDAAKWARNFKKLFPHTDEETMVAWFANAIMAGYDRAKKENRTRVQKMQDCLDVQAADGNWNANDYMLGLFNGLEHMMAIMEDRDPQFRTLPEPATSQVTGERQVWAEAYGAALRYRSQTTDIVSAKKRAAEDADDSVKLFRERYK